DGPGRPGALDRALPTGPGEDPGDGRPAALGPTVAPADAERSLHWARTALRLLGDGVIEPGGLVRCVEHLPALVVNQDSALAGVLAVAVLAPLDELPAGERARLCLTLRAWLDHQRHTPQIAAQLHVHPQTVRYRMAKLSELLGDTLNTPDGRFALALALRTAGGADAGRP
ncbi:MAG: helix-turn-helix domain-containing protein, partial [Actinomycetota bacterium]|nr:helix-turn-helix domain-containing protein [Actinomycetota bacterium]